MLGKGLPVITLACNPTAPSLLPDTESTDRAFCSEEEALSEINPINAALHCGWLDVLGARDVHLHVHDDLKLRLEQGLEALARGRCQEVPAASRVGVHNDR